MFIIMEQAYDRTDGLSYENPIGVRETRTEAFELVTKLNESCTDDDIQYEYKEVSKYLLTGMSSKHSDPEIRKNAIKDHLRHIYIQGSTIYARYHTADWYKAQFYAGGEFNPSLWVQNMTTQAHSIFRHVDSNELKNIIINTIKSSPGEMQLQTINVVADFDLHVGYKTTTVKKELELTQKFYNMVYEFAKDKSAI